MSMRLMQLMKLTATATAGNGEGATQMRVRRERPGDGPAVSAVHRAAFGRTVEDELNRRLHEGPWWLPHFSLVAACPDGSVVGHVIATRGYVDRAPVLGLGPLGVLPEHQGRGCGSALVHELLGAAQARDEALVALLGDPAYYRRFGFRHAAELGVTAPEPSWGEHFQALALVDDAPCGLFRYADPFGVGGS
jgi:putative acetyltransferase